MKSSRGAKVPTSLGSKATDRPISASSNHARTEGPIERSLERLTILGVPVYALDREELTATFSSLLREGKKGWISYVNIHAVNLAQEFPWFRDFLARALITYCDGQGVRLGAAILGGHLPERIVMSEWIYDVCAVGEKENVKLFLLGSTDRVLQKAQRTLLQRFPRLLIVGTRHGYFAEEETNRIVQSINVSAADVLIVGMGMPKQERWILHNYDKLNVSVFLNAGSCFDFVADEKPRCPSWLGRIGGEWLFRLILEPRRLWKRYLIGNPLFLSRVLRERLRIQK